MVIRWSNPRCGASSRSGYGARRAGAHGPTHLPSDERPDDLLELCQTERDLIRVNMELIAVNADMSNIINKLEKMEKCGYIDLEVTDKYRDQMKDAGREDEKW